MFLLVLAHPDSPVQRAIKQLCVCACSGSNSCLSQKNMSKLTQSYESQPKIKISHTTM